MAATLTRVVVALTRRFASTRDGMAAVEFALVMPFLLVLTLAGGQVMQYINAFRKCESVANGIASMISQAMPPSSSTTIATVNWIDLNFSYDATMVMFPYVLADSKNKNVTWRSDITVSYASITFTQTSTSCTGQTDQSPCYVAKVAWTSTGTSSNSYRPCIVPQLPVDDGSPYNRSTLPRSVFGPGSVIAVDVTFTFTPTFGSGFIAPVTITRSAFMQPRYATQINFDSTGSDGIASTCT